MTRQAAFFSTGLVAVVLDAQPMATVITNSDRIIVYANASFRNIVDIPHNHDVIGLRLGKALGCANVAEAEAECGETRFCTYCGAAKAILLSLSGRSATEECHVARHLRNKYQSLVFQVWSEPLSTCGEHFAIHTLVDIAHEKLLTEIEAKLCTDMLGITTDMAEVATQLDDGLDPHFARDVDALRLGLGNLQDIIITHKEFLEAENGVLDVQLRHLGSVQLLSDVLGFYAAHPQAKGKSLSLAPDCPDISFRSDRRLLVRILLAMVGNALEAAHPGETVTLGCRMFGHFLRFFVHNPGVVPEHVQAHVFKRSFSTKGPGRGLGTYSIRLFCENYLGGKASFDSAPELGTSFKVDLPLDLT